MTVIMHKAYNAHEVRGALDGLDFCYVYSHDSNHVSDVSEAWMQVEMSWH